MWAEIFLGYTKCCPKKNLVQHFFGSKCFLAEIEFGLNFFCDQNKIRVKICIGRGENLDQKKMWVKKNFGKNNVGQKKNWVKKKFCRKKKLGHFFWHISSSLVELRLHSENQLHR